LPIHAAVPFVSGFLAGYMSFNYMPYEAIYYFVVSKVFELTQDALDKKGVWKKTRYDEILLCFVYTMISCYAFLNEPSQVNKSIFQIYYKFSTFDYNLLKMIQTVQ
jgi:hypothetical protein